MAAQISYQASERLVNSFARRVMRRAQAAGAKSVQLADIVQECWVAWCQARDRYDATTGVPFGAYLMRGMQQHINRWIKEEIGERLMAPVALDATGGDDEDDNSLHNVIADGGSLPDEIVELANQKAYVLERLSPLARQFVTLLTDPPKELLEEVQAIQARAEWGRSRGLNTFAPRDVTAPLVFDLMGLNRTDRSKIYRELRLLAEEVSK